MTGLGKRCTDITIPSDFQGPVTPLGFAIVCNQIEAFHKLLDHPDMDSSLNTVSSNLHMSVHMYMSYVCTCDIHVHIYVYVHILLAVVHEYPAM